jgi:hypothetical protein
MFMNNPNDHILKTPYAVGCLVWFATETKRASPRVSRVCSGCMIPSSQSLDVA